jgi:hypothetical protein
MSDDQTGDGPATDSDEPLAGSASQAASDESGSSVRDSIVLRQGDPNEFDEQDTTEIVPPDDTSWA